MNRCNACGGMMQLVPTSHLNERAQFTDDDGNRWNLSCMMCGRTNAPPVSIDDLRNERVTALRSRRNRPHRDRQKALKDVEYRKFLGVLSEQMEPFITQEITAAMGMLSPKVGAWLRRARSDGWVRNAGLQSVWSDKGHHYQVVIWETIREARKATG